MSVHELSAADARRIAIRAQLLDAQKPAGLLEVVRHLTLLQIDPTAAIAPNADLAVWTRLGSAYSTAELREARDKQTLIELDAMIRPAEDFALYRADMAAWDQPRPGESPCTRPPEPGYAPTTRAAATSWTGSPRPDLCHPATCPIRAGSRGARPAGRTTATSPGCWTS